MYGHVSTKEQATEGVSLEAQRSIADRYETETASDFLSNHITIGFAEHERLDSDAAVC